MARAVRYEQFGPPEVLQVVQVEEPQAGPGELRVRMKAVGLNPVDYKIRNGSSAYPVTLPAGIGRELAGIIDRVGDGVTRFHAGDEVFGTVPGDSIADYLVADATYFAAKPPSLSWEVAGSLALAGQTAFDELASQNVTASDTVLVSAAAGGVGVIVSQLARRVGATVIGTASETNHPFLRELGVIPVTYGPGLADRVRAAAPAPVSVVFDHHGAETIETALQLGVDPNRINTIATDPAPWGVRRVGRGPTNTATLDTLARLVANGELVVPIEAAYPMADVSEAFTRLEQGHLRGKVVVVN